MPTPHRVKVPSPRGAFTLIELLIVISIIGILAAALVVGAMHLIDAAKVKKSDAILDNLAQALQDYYSDFGAFPPMSSAPAVNSNDIEWWRYLTCTGSAFERPRRSDGTIRQEPFIDEKDLNLSSASVRLPRDAWKKDVLYVYPADNEIANLTSTDTTLPTPMRTMSLADTYYHCLVIHGGKNNVMPAIQNVATRNVNTTAEPPPAYKKKVISGK